MVGVVQSEQVISFLREKIDRDRLQIPESSPITFV